MDFKEANDWLNGVRSMTNLVPREPFATWEVRVAQADAVMMEQAYWCDRAYREMPPEERGKVERIFSGDHFHEDNGEYFHTRTGCRIYLVPKPNR